MRRVRAGSSVSVHEAKTHLSRLLDRVLSGEEVAISRSGSIVAKLVRAGTTRKPRVPDRDKGKVTIPPDFDDELPSSIIESFES